MAPLSISSESLPDDCSVVDKLQRHVESCTAARIDVRPIDQSRHDETADPNVDAAVSRPGDASSTTTPGSSPSFRSLPAGVDAAAGERIAVGFDGANSASLRLLARAMSVVAAIDLRFLDAASEREAQRELLVHLLRGITTTMGVWTVCWVCIAVANAILTPEQSPPRQQYATGVVSLRQGFLLLSASLSAILLVAARMAWSLQEQLGDSAIKWAFSGLVALHIVFLGGMTWFFVGPGSALMVPFASAWGAGASIDPEGGPFQGHLLLSVILVAYMQSVAHARLPFVHTAVVAAACQVIVACVAPPLMFASEPRVPVALANVSVFGLVLGVSSNALTSTIAAYLWEARLRQQLLTVAATRAAQADSTRLLNNLMPPSVVAAITAGQDVTPVCASNVVILVRSKRAHAAVLRSPHSGRRRSVTSWASQV